MTVPLTQCRYWMRPVTSIAVLSMERTRSLQGEDSHHGDVKCFREEKGTFRRGRSLVILNEDPGIGGVTAGAKRVFS
ncbi:MAG TPA: hypothetical protein PLE70_06210 [Methanolinea sp.]|nr:hypothetical protein [Methanolinea sp.]